MLKQIDTCRWPHPFRDPLRSVSLIFFLLCLSG